MYQGKGTQLTSFILFPQNKINDSPPQIDKHKKSGQNLPQVLAVFLLWLKIYLSIPRQNVL